LYVVDELIRFAGLQLTRA